MAFQIGRIPFEVQCCPLRSASFARFESFGKMLVAAFHPAVMRPLAGSEGASISIRRLTETVATVYDHGVSHEDISVLVQVFVAGFPLPMLTARA